MAQLKNLARIWTAPLGEMVTVGNSRRIVRNGREGGGIAFTCYLHGAPIVKIVPHGGRGTATVKLNTCGYLTTTTVAAMKDFMDAFGIKAVASRAGGKLSARWYQDGWHERDSSDGESMSFSADRHPATADA